MILGKDGYPYTNNFILKIKLFVRTHKNTRKGAISQNYLFNTQNVHILVKVLYDKNICPDTQNVHMLVKGYMTKIFVQTHKIFVSSKRAI